MALRAWPDSSKCLQASEMACLGYFGGLTRKAGLQPAWQNYKGLNIWSVPLSYVASTRSNGDETRLLDNQLLLGYIIVAIFHWMIFQPLHKLAWIYLLDPVCQPYQVRNCKSHFSCININMNAYPHVKRDTIIWKFRHFIGFSNIWLYVPVLHSSL